MHILFDFANQKIGIEGEGPELVELFTIIRDIAPKLPSITVTTTPVATPAPVLTGGSTAGVTGNGGNGSGQNVLGTPNQTMRQFVKSLSLAGLSEKIAAVAYYQARVLGRPTFAPKDMSDWFTQCGLEKPSQMPVAVFDAKKRMGYIENAGHGSWKLATQGENMIIRKIEEATEKKE